MPTAHELLILVVAILVLWIVLKVAKVAIKLMFLFIGLAVVAGVVWWFFSAR